MTNYVSEIEHTYLNVTNRDKGGCHVSDRQHLTLHELNTLAYSSFFSIEKMMKNGQN